MKEIYISVSDFTCEDVRYFVCKQFKIPENFKDQMGLKIGALQFDATRVNQNPKLALLELGLSAEDTVEIICPEAPNPTISTPLSNSIKTAIPLSNSTKTLPHTPPVTVKLPTTTTPTSVQPMVANSTNETSTTPNLDAESMFLRAHLIQALTDQIIESPIQFHFHIVCDGCEKKNFAGVRFKCTTCNDFDFCFDCFRTRENKHPANHNFLEILEPKLKVYLKEFNLYLPKHEHILCGGCKTSPVLGPRFKCLSCADFDLCWKCHGKTHNHHNFSKIATGTDWHKL